MKKYLLYKFFITLLLLLIQPLSGQVEGPYLFENYSNREGFDQNTVMAIEQDKYGTFWLGTANGLMRYDGYSFYDVSWELEYQSDIFDERIRDILADRQGLLWILSRNGLSIYNPTQESFLKVTSESMTSPIGLKEDVSGSIWVHGYGYIANVTADLKTDTIITHWIPNLFPAELAAVRINDLLRVNENLYLLATSHGICKMMLSESTTDPEFEFDFLLSETRVNSLVRQDDIIWIGTEKGLYKAVMDGGNLRNLNSYLHDNSDPATIGGNDVRDLLVGPDDRLWIGTWDGGLSMLNNEEKIFTNFQHDPRRIKSISSSMINCIYKDQFDVLWIGTAQGGISKLDLRRKPFTNIEHNPYDERSIPGNLINSILEDSEGYLWISSYENPLCISLEPVSAKNVNHLTFRRFENWHNTFGDKNIKSIYEDKHGLIWLGYDNDLVVYDRRKDSFTEIELTRKGEADPIELVNINFIGTIDEEKILIAGNHIMILEDPWQYIRSGKKSRIPVFAYSDEGGVITAEVEGPESIWTGHSGDGLFQYSLVEDSLLMIKNYRFNGEDRTSISNNSVFCIHKDSEQRLWVGTFGGGLNRMNGKDGQREGGFDRLRDTLDLNDNVLYGIIEENDSILWLSTDLGIFKLNKKSLETTRFNMSDGIASNNFRKNAYYKGPSGYYYFGGLYGLTLFKPEQIKLNPIPPEIVLSSLRINNKKITPGEQINGKFILEKHISEISRLVLTQAARTMALDLIVMHTSTPGKNSFSYMLEGFDEDWIEVHKGSYTLNYTNLPHGKYNLRIRGFNGDGIQSENETILNLIMLAPWYAQLWSKFLFSLIGLSVILGISIYLIKLKNLQNSLKYEKIDKERIKEINKTKLRFFTNISHEFRTPLALISIPLQKLQETDIDNEQKKHLIAAEKNTNKLIRLIDQLLTFRKIENERMKLRLSLTSLDDFLYPIAEAFDALSMDREIEFHYQVKDPELRYAIDLENMEQVIYNLLSNAFKFTLPGGKVTLVGRSCMIKNKQHVCFEVRDTGKGIPKKEQNKIFERFYQSDSDLRNTGTGIGLSYSKSIVELHNGQIHVESTPGTETLFSVIIPLSEINHTVSVEQEVKRMNPLEMIEFADLTTGTDPALPEKHNGKRTILIVDDEVEFRTAIKDIFKKNFRILEASNGKDALDITREKNPDLIISDVMMPVMNGYDFCNSVKTDIELCHIPFILLTALEDMENHIQGEMHGADSYIIKPFNLKYLEVNAQKLIENREKIQEHFSRNHSLPKNIKISGIDRDFIESVNESILENLSNSSFGVEELANKISLSSSHFCRKLKLLTGQVPNVYIRNIRLQVAADLISGNPGIGIKNVMYEVGFESASHFSHAFKKKFGYSPSETNPG